MAAATEDVAAPAAAAARRRRAPLPRRGWRDRVPAVLAAVGALLLWQAVIMIFDVPGFIAPSPLEVVETLVTKADLFWRNLIPTFFEAVAGFVCGNGVAILLAVWFVHSRTAERSLYPIMVFINTIPILALAPILVLLFGNGYTPKVIIAALICFFPTLVNMVRGLKAVNPATLDLMRILSASPTEILWRVRLPCSLPFLFAALKIASTTCVIGAVVGEWVGSNEGLGAVILQAMYDYRTPTLYATVTLAAGMAVAFFALFSHLERRLIRWKAADVH
ncbi:MAG: ABC transporter permease [Alphaproteobacteria bacterium]